MNNLFIKLTHVNGLVRRVDINNIGFYEPHGDYQSTVFLKYSGSFIVKESCEEIDKMVNIN